jgi:hypothetical protein
LDSLPDKLSQAVKQCLDLKRIGEMQMQAAAAFQLAFRATAGVPGACVWIMLCTVVYCLLLSCTVLYCRVLFALCLRGVGVDCDGWCARLSLASMQTRR